MLENIRAERPAWQKTRHCRHCDKAFMPQRRWQEYCKPECRVRKWKEKNNPVDQKAMKEITQLKIRLDRIEAHLGIGRES